MNNRYMYVRLDIYFSQKQDFPVNNMQFPRRH